MAWNGSGTFSRLYNWVTDRDAGVKIQATRMDGEDDGFATGINACLAKNGENAATGNLNLGGYRYTNAATPTALTDLATALYAKSAGASTSLVISAGTANAQTVTNSLAYTALTAGIVQWFLPGNANTGACTIAVDGLTAKNIYAYGAALIGGELQTTVPAWLKYDGTQWNLLNPQKATGSFTATGTGFSGAAPTGTFYYTRVNGICILDFPTTNVGISGTSNSTSFGLTGLPAACFPATDKVISGLTAIDSGSVNIARMNITAAGAINMIYGSGTTTTNWTASGTKSLRGFSVSYSLS